MLYYKEIPIFSTACIAGILSEDTWNSACQVCLLRRRDAMVYVPLIQHPEDAAYTGWLSARAM